MNSLFIISLTYKRPLAEVDQYIAEHVAFLDKYYALEKFIFSGRKIPRTGGVILARKVSREELDLILEEDPFRVQGVAEYEITELLPTKYDGRFSVFLDDAAG